jgi:asparagine synthase (glutamine-hydrolysing)
LTQKLQLREIAKKTAPPLRSERDHHLRLLERELIARAIESLAHVSGAFDIEVRFPFMDIRLIEYCLSLPSDQKLRGEYTRFVLHNGMAGILPDKIQRRGGKSNLSPSFEKGLLKFEKDNLRKIILEETDQLAAYVHMGRIKECLGRFERGAANENEIIIVWTTVALALWLRSRSSATKEFILKRKEVKYA